MATLERARSQFEIFNIKLEDGSVRNGISALLGEIDRSGLHFDINEVLPEDLACNKAVIYFKVRSDGLPVFYAFDSKIIKVTPNPSNSHIVLAVPEHLRIEKKRHFIRVQPGASLIQDISVWNLVQGQSLPLSLDSLPAPVCQFSKDEHSVQLEDISASGLALKFYSSAISRVHSQVRSQLLCLVVYKPDVNDTPVYFWCTGEVMNRRNTDGNPPVSILGLEFTNWAILKTAEGEIHWSHNSPTRGVRPILQWVEKIDRHESRNEATTDPTIHG